MEIGTLLEELINIAQVSKTDFALSMNMTPSGLSKILTGTRLPNIKEKIAFCKQTAAYLTNAIYCSGCYLKFTNIFPVIYDFDSKYELESFLICAIEYALDKSILIENNVNLDYPEKETSFLGKKSVLNIFCVIISDCITNDRNTELEFYSTLRFFNPLYSDIFRRIKITNSMKQKNIFYNHFFDMQSFETACAESGAEILLKIANLQQYFDLNLWEIKRDIDPSFLLLKGQFLIIFNILPDGTPLMTYITHKSYLAMFFNSIMKKDAKKISYNKSEATESFDDNLSLVDKLIDKKIDAVYNFISIGYLIKTEDLRNKKADKTIKNGVLKLFEEILSKDTTFFVSVDAMMAFYQTGKAIVPFVETVDFSISERSSYLKRFESYIIGENHDKIRLLNIEMPKIAILCTSDLNIIYLIDNEYKNEKIHCFGSNMINSMMTNEILKKDHAIVDFSLDLWETYIGGLSETKIN